jgi:uncharacterized repeat protein (TIGR02543 family)
MAGKKKPGLEGDKKTYGCCKNCSIAKWTPNTSTGYTVTYNGNTNTSGTAPVDGSSPYNSGSTVTILGNTGTPVLVKTGYTFAGWNTAADGSGTNYVGGNTFTINADTTLYARWTPVAPTTTTTTTTTTAPPTTYTVTYNGNTNNSGIVPVDGSSPYTAGSTVTILGNTGTPVLVKTGYTFAGWNTAADGSGTNYVGGNTFTINADTTLYARWTPVAPTTYTVTYLGNTNTAGTAPVDGSSPYNSGSTVTILGNTGSPVLAKSGYQFAGWNTTADGSGTNYVGGDTFTINANTTLYANWIIGGVRLRYNAGTGGSGTAPSSSETYYSAFSTADVVGNTGSFTNSSGYVFGGWNTLANGTGTSYPPGSEYSMPGSGTVTLYAQWINPAVTYTLTYNAGTNGSGTDPAPVTPYSSKATAIILGNTGPYTNSDPTKIFYGWNTAADGTGTSYPAGSTLTMTANTTLYAQWVSSTPQYLVTYVANGATGGTVPAAPTNYPGGVQVPILGKGSLTNPGYTFLGWNSSPTGAGSLYAPGYTFTSKAATLYAQWAPGSPVKTCSGSGSGVFTFIFPFAQVIASTNTITIYTTALFGTTATNYGSGLAPEGIISLTSKTVITSATITINTNTSYLNSANDYNYAYTITNGSGVAYWPSGATISSITFPTFTNNPFLTPPTYNNSSPLTYRLSTRNCSNGCGLGVSVGGGVIAPVSYNVSFFNQGVTLNYSDGTNTIFVASPTNSFYSTNSGAIPVVYSQTPNSLYPYSLIIPQRPFPVTASASSAALTSMTIIPSTASEYIYPPMPDYTVQYDGNGATGGAIRTPVYMSPYTATTTTTIGGNTGSLTKTGFTFSRWNTAADGSGTNYGPGYTTTYSGGASIILYAIWV